jgi:hypothetical protein
MQVGAVVVGVRHKVLTLVLEVLVAEVMVLELTQLLVMVEQELLIQVQAVVEV